MHLCDKEYIKTSADKRRPTNRTKSREERAEKPSVELSKARQTGSRTSRRSAAYGEEAYPPTKQDAVG